MATSLPKASDLGILANGTDQTAALNAIFLNSAYAGVVIDYSSPAAVTISGALNCQNKQLIFAPLSYLTGSGTVSNCVINAGYRQKCFDITLTISTSSTATEYFSALWFGADPNGVSDSQPSIQKSINTAIANSSINTVFLPGGTYSINAPLLISNWNGSAYAQVTINLIGEGKFWQGSTGGTRVNCTFANTFALGIQVGKGNLVSGIFFKGKFTPPTLTTYQFYTCAFSAFTDGVSRDQPFSPYAGIVIDPFGPVVPSDGGYPGYSSFYHGGSGGSTGVEIEDCIVSNFVTGIITSPNGQTSNAELMLWNKIQFANCKACIVGCQTQEKMNRVTEAACWIASHTFFHSGTYGVGAPGNWYLKGINLAGQINRFITRHGAGYFPMHVSEVYAESIGTVGEWTGNQGDSLQDSSFNFVTPNLFPAYPNYPTSSHFTSPGITTKNCEFRYYGWYLPLVFNGGIFEDCSFDQLPYGTADMRNCSCYNGAINPQSDTLGVNRIAACRSLAGGRGKFVDYGDYSEGKQVSLNYKDYNSAGFLQIDGLTGANSAFTVSSNVATVTPPSPADLSRVIIGRLAFNFTTGSLLGVVTAVGASTYTISYVPDGVVSGNYLIYLWCPVVNFSFMGTCTAGSPVITNVTIDFGSYADLVSYGGGFVKIPNFYGFRSYTQGAKIIAYDGVAATFTMDRPAYASATNYYFANNGAVKEINVLSINNSSYLSGSGVRNAEIFPKGSEFITDTPFISNTGRHRFIITLTGFYSGTPQATWTDIT